MNIIIFGPQGSGKGTQAQLLSETFGMHHISSGDILRDGATLGDKKCQKLKKLLDAGELVPDKEIISIIKEHIKEDDNIFDGFPRTLEQAHELDDIIEIDLVIELNIPDEEVIKRMKLRKRDDDKEELIKKRLEHYHDETEPLIEYYRPRGIVHTINANRPIQEIFNDLVKIVEKNK